MTRRTMTYVLVWMMAAMATVVASNTAHGSGTGRIVVDDHASWLVRDLWQFEAVVVEAICASPAPAEPRRALLIALVPDRQAGLDPEYESWLRRDLWQFTQIPTPAEATEQDD